MRNSSWLFRAVPVFELSAVIIQKGENTGSSPKPEPPKIDTANPLALPKFTPIHDICPLNHSRHVAYNTLPPHPDRSLYLAQLTEDDLSLFPSDLDSRRDPVVATPFSPPRSPSTLLR